MYGYFEKFFKSLQFSAGAVKRAIFISVMSPLYEQYVGFRKTYSKY